MRRLLLIALAVVVLSTLVGASVAVADPVVMAAGDIACASAGISSPGACSQAYTANLLTAQRNSAEGLAGVLTLGDDQYENGGLADFRKYFGPTWGQLSAILHPALGNHEYQTSGAAGYFDYFSELGVSVGNRGEGWYSFDIGSWHLVALNSSDACKPVSCAKGSPQEVWLKQDLASTQQPCILAYWHHPLSSVSAERDMWQDLYDAGADLVLVGHVHTYKKPVAHDASGHPDPNGPREVVVGTGGKSGGIYGVVKLMLHDASFDWRFVGSGTSDSGSAACHGPTPPATKPTASFTTATSGLTATLTDTSTGSPTSWSWDFGDGVTSTAQSPSHTYAQQGTYTVRLSATNAGGSDTATQQVTVSGGQPPASAATLVGDASVNAGSPNSNYGSDTTLRVKTGVYRSFLKFTVSGLADRVTAATLKLRSITQPSPDGGDVYLVANTLKDGTTPWSESNITWNTTPDLGASKLGTAGAVDPATNNGIVTIPLDAGAFAGGDGTYSLALDSHSSTSAYYSSKEGGTPAQLLLTTAANPPPPPAPPVASFTSSPSSPSLISTSTNPADDNVQLKQAGKAPRSGRARVGSAALRKGWIAVRITCRAGGAACRGTLRVSARGHTLASASYRVAAGASHVVRARPTRAGRAILHGARRLKVTVRLKPRGGGTAVTRTVTLRR
jgi:serine protease